MYYCLICGYEKLEKPQYEKGIYPTFKYAPVVDSKQDLKIYLKVYVLYNSEVNG